MRKVGKNMDKIIKLIPVAVVVAVGACIAVVIATIGMKEENDISEVATSQQIIQVHDNTATTSSKETFRTEAEKLWSLNKEKFVCDESKFIEEYIGYRESGLADKLAYNSLYNSYAKEFQVETNPEGEVVADGFNADNVIDDKNEEPTVSEEETTAPIQEENQYTVEEIKPIKMYVFEAVNIRKGPHSSDFDKVGSLNEGTYVTVVGIVKTYKGATTLWYQLDNGNFVSGAYLSDKMPEKETVQQQTSTQQQTTVQKHEETTKKEETTTSKADDNKPVIVYNGDGTVTINGKTFKLGDDIIEEKMTTGDLDNVEDGKNYIGN